MTLRNIQFILAVVLLSTLSSCPPVPTASLQLGTWIFKNSFLPDSEFALTLLPGGETTTPNPLPPEADTSFSGEIIWAEEAPTFLLYQKLSIDRLIYVGEVLSPTAMQGIIEGTANGTWSATFLR